MIAWNNVELLVELKPAKKNFWPKFGPNRPKLGLKLGFMPFSQVLFISFSLNWGGGVEPPTQFSKRGGSTGPQFLEGVAGKEGGDFFQGGRGVQFLHKK